MVAVGDPVAARTTPTARLGPAEELEVALAAAASFQSATQQADSKAGTLTALHVGITAIVVTQFGQLSPARFAGLLAVLCWGFMVAFLVAFVVTGTLLVRAIRPRTAPPRGRNRFAFPSVTSADDYPGEGVTATDLGVEAWALAKALAGIAAAKNAQLGLAVGWLAAMLVVAAGWLGTTGLPR